MNHNEERLERRREAIAAWCKRQVEEVGAQMSTGNTSEGHWYMTLTFEDQFEVPPEKLAGFRKVLEFASGINLDINPCGETWHQITFFVW